MENERSHRCKLSFLILVIILAILYFPSLHANATARVDREKTVIFLLDVSGSMKSNDPERLAIDSIAQLIYSLPTNYKVGFVAYHSDIAAEQAPVDNSQRSQIMSAAEQVDYVGYSNAGIGLEHALALLNEQKASEKCIVMLSDGEVLMEDEEKTEQSRQQYRNAVNTARDRAVKIHVVGLEDEMEDMDNSIFEAATLTGGKAFYTPQAVGIQAAIDSIMNYELGIKQSTGAIIDADGDLESVSIALPYTHASKVRALLTATAPITNLSTNFQATTATQINGIRYSLIEMNRPTCENLQISFEGTAGSQVRINLIPEYCVAVKGEVQYYDEIPTQEDALYYERSAEITYSFFDADNTDIQIWTQDFFQYKKVFVEENGEVQEVSLNEGTVQTMHQVQETMRIETQLDYSQMPVNVIESDGVELTLEEPLLLPVEEAKPPYAFIAAGITAAIALIIIIVLVIRHRRKPKVLPTLPEDRPEPGKYSYVGKVNIYITRTQSGYDIPPLSFNLFRLPEGRVISLQEILESCDVKEHFEGADSIYFKSGANHNLVITNNSDCTIMKNREILMKKKSYQLPPESKVDVTFEDEISELTFQYKDLK